MRFVVQQSGHNTTVILKAGNTAARLDSKTSGWLQHGWVSMRKGRTNGPAELEGRADPDGALWPFNHAGARGLRLNSVAV